MMSRSGQRRLNQAYKNANDQQDAIAASRERERMEKSVQKMARPNLLLQPKPGRISPSFTNATVWEMQFLEKKGGAGFIRAKVRGRDVDFGLSIIADNGQPIRFFLTPTVGAGRGIYELASGRLLASDVTDGLVLAKVFDQLSNGTESQLKSYPLRHRDGLENYQWIEPHQDRETNPLQLRARALKLKLALLTL